MSMPSPPLPRPPLAGMSMQPGPCLRPRLQPPPRPRLSCPGSDPTGHLQTRRARAYPTAYPGCLVCPARSHLISILPSSPCSNPPPLHRPPYCNSTVPPSSQAHTAEHSTSSSTAALPEPGYPRRLQSTTPHVLGLGLVAPSYVPPSLSCLAPANSSPVEKSSTCSSALLCAPPPPVLHRAPHIGPPCPARPASCSPCRCCLSTRETPARAHVPNTHATNTIRSCNAGIRLLPMCCRRPTRARTNAPAQVASAPKIGPPLRPRTPRTPQVISAKTARQLCSCRCISPPPCRENAHCAMWPPPADRVPSGMGTFSVFQ